MEMFLINISIGLIVALIWGISFHLYTQKREQNRLWKNFKGDLEYNRNIMEKIENALSRSEYVINIAHNTYAINGIREFLYLGPLKEGEIYKKLMSLVISFESSNKIMECALVRNDADQHVMISNHLLEQTQNIKDLFRDLQESKLY